MPKFQNGDELVQDNAPIHASMSTRDWLKSNNVPLIQWPSNSPDLNPIENLWGHISRQLYENGTQFHSVRELKSKLLSEWRRIYRVTKKSLPYFNFILHENKKNKNVCARTCRKLILLFSL